MNQMRNGAVVLVVLLMLAASSLSAIWFTGTMPQRFGGLGFVIAQIILATAATIFLNRWLWLRLLVLAGVILCTSSWIGSHSGFSPLQIGLHLISVAMVAAAWCGGLRFCGWRVEGLGAEPRSSTPARQFSLATAMLVMTIVAVYLGLLRWSGLTWEDGGNFLTLCCGLAVPGCLLMLSTIRGRWNCLVVLAGVVLASAILYVLTDNLLSDLTAAFAAAALTMECIFIVAVAVVLQVAGIRLRREFKMPPTEVTSGRAAQPLA